MWILFSPSEKKCLTHTNATPPKEAFHQNFICSPLGEILQAYVQYLQHASHTQLQKLFGTKTLPLNALSLAQNLLYSPLLDSIERYVGVAFEALDYANLDDKAKTYLKAHLVIFSNLFGPLRATDKIPYYDLKQGEGFCYKTLCFSTKDLYRENSAKIWEFLNTNHLESLEFLDLRAGFYQKCFPLNPMPLQGKNLHIIIPSFVKSGKTLSHYAKFYRGILLRNCAKLGILNLQNLLEVEILGLTLSDKNTIHEGNTTQTFLTYTIV